MPASDIANSIRLNREQPAHAIANAPQRIGSADNAPGFDWHDAAIGAGAVALLATIAACSLLIVRHHRHLAV